MIFATFADNELFVPCLLQMLDDAAVSELRESFQSTVVPLVLKFPHGGPRLGLFHVLFDINRHETLSLGPKNEPQFCPACLPLPELYPTYYDTCFMFNYVD